MRLRFATCLGLAVAVTVLAAPQLHAQSSPGLAVQLSSSNTQLTVTGDVGSPLTVQYATNLDGPWLVLSNRTLVTSSTLFTDPTAPKSSSRYYRTIIVVPTNMMWISAGTFLMGSPTNELERSTTEVQHSVTL